MASIRRIRRRAVFRSLATQYFRSSRNSGWKTASRDLSGKPNLALDFFDGHGLPPTFQCSGQGLQ